MRAVLLPKPCSTVITTCRTTVVHPLPGYIRSAWRAAQHDSKEWRISGTGGGVGWGHCVGGRGALGPSSSPKPCGGGMGFCVGRLPGYECQAHSRAPPTVLREPVSLRMTMHTKRGEVGVGILQL